jgi:hypothetical protein
MAEEKKEPRHKKMYKDSPALKRGDDGKMAISKGKKDAKDGGGKEGVPEQEKNTLDMTQRHAMERLELHHKHEKEHAELAQKYMGSPASADAGGEEAEAAPQKDKKETDKE